MKNKLKILVGASGFALAAISAGPAFAAGTAAGTSVMNTATINFTVGGIAQTAVTAADTFVVDRQVNLTVAEVGTTTTNVTPGQTQAVTAFTVTNTGNDVQDFDLTVVQPNNAGAAPHGGTDGFDVTGVTIYSDTNNNGAFDAGTDTAITFLDEVLADSSRTVFVVANIPLNLINGQKAVVRLIAQTLDGGAASTKGSVSAATTGPEAAGTKDTVFIDGAGTDDAARDGIFSTRDDYTVLAPEVTVAKFSWVISDPINGTTNPKRIPGAVIGYCITITTSPTSPVTVESPTISDTLPEEVTYVANSFLVAGSTTGTTCADGAPGGTYNASTRTITSAPFNSLAANRLELGWFQATVN